jgi:hypothetical protein
MRCPGCANRFVQCACKTFIVRFAVYVSGSEAMVSVVLRLTATTTEEATSIGWTQLFAHDDSRNSLDFSRLRQVTLDSVEQDDAR